MAHRQNVCVAWGTRATREWGLEEGQLFHAQLLRRRVAPYGARDERLSLPHATRTYGPCAVGLPQVKAAGLVQAFDLLGRIT